MIGTPSLIILVNKSRVMEMAGHAACIGEEVHTGFSWGNLKERVHFEDPGFDGKIILELILSKSVGRECGLD